jgi:hypothetical protein
MRNMTKLAGIFVLAVAVTACSNEAEAPEANEVSETRMDDVDIIDGTISDDMVDVDSEASSDQPAEGDEESDEDSSEEESE